MQFENFEAEQAEFEHEHRAPTPWAGEAQGEMELAAELLGVSSEQELEHFFGKMLKGLGAFARSPAGQQLQGLLKSTAKQLLPSEEQLRAAGRNAIPQAAQILGRHFGGDRGAHMGQDIGQAVVHGTGLELEGLSHEDREFETARQVVRLAQDSAARLPGPQATAQDARRAYVDAVRNHAPGLIRAVGSSAPAAQRHGAQFGGVPQSGSWQRQGQALILRR